MIQQKTLYYPNTKPWNAKRAGTDRLVWYTVFDKTGNEVFHTNKVELQDEAQVQNNLVMMLSVVNESNVVKIDNDEIAVEWK